MKNGFFRFLTSFNASSSRELSSLRPFISVLIIIATLFGVVFLQMEERRLSYSVLKLSRAYKQELQKLKIKEIEVAKAFRPQHVERIARDRLTMKRISPKQIIRLNSSTGEASKPNLSSDSILDSDSIVNPNESKSTFSKKEKSKVEMVQDALSKLSGSLVR